METGNIVKVKPSDSLTKLKLKKLAGSKGEIIETIYSTGNKAIGCWVKLDKPFENESEWFIPIDSIDILKQE